jgi:hypothetical protein
MNEGMPIDDHGRRDDERIHTNNGILFSDRNVVAHWVSADTINDMGDAGANIDQSGRNMENQHLFRHRSCLLTMDKHNDPVVPFIERSRMFVRAPRRRVRTWYCSQE